jgi:hypothetical protein
MVAAWKRDTLEGFGPFPYFLSEAEAGAVQCSPIPPCDFVLSPFSALPFHKMENLDKVFRVTSLRFRASLLGLVLTDAVLTDIEIDNEPTRTCVSLVDLHADRLIQIFQNRVGALNLISYRVRPVENQIRTYWWCSPPRIGRQRICPARSTARENGASFSRDRCVRAPLYNEV